MWDLMLGVEDIPCLSFNTFGPISFFDHFWDQIS